MPSKVQIRLLSTAGAMTTIVTALIAFGPVAMTDEASSAVAQAAAPVPADDPPWACVQSQSQSNTKGCTAADNQKADEADGDAKSSSPPAKDKCSHDNLPGSDIGHAGCEWMRDHVDPNWGAGN